MALHRLSAQHRWIPRHASARGLRRPAGALWWHEAAAGFTLRPDAYDAFTARLLATQPTRSAPPTWCPAAVDDHRAARADDATPRAAALGPWRSNPEPLLASRGLVLRDVRRMGRDDRHLRLRVSVARAPSSAWAGACAGRAVRRRPGRRLALQPRDRHLQRQRVATLNLVSVRPAQ